MDNQEREKITAKIKKLLALATSPNEAEAKLASERAQEMLVRYNLSMQDVQKSNNDYTVYNFDTSKRKKVSDKFVYSLIVQFFFVRIVNQKALSNGEFIIIRNFVGEKHNVEIAKYTYDFLVRVFNKAWRDYKKSTGCGSGSRESFFYGLHNGIAETLMVSRQKVEQSMALVVSKEDPNLDAFLNNEFGKLKNVPAKSSGSLGDPEALDAGAKEGLKVTISKGIETKSTDMSGQIDFGGVK
jgi:hypothetical protein